MAEPEKPPLDRSAAPPPPPQPRWLVILAGLALLLALLALWYYLRQAPDASASVSSREPILTSALQNRAVADVTGSPQHSRVVGVRVCS